MSASTLALGLLAFALTYAIHSTLLLGLACLITPRCVRSLAARERIWKTALVGGVLTAAIQVGARLETPLFHWTLDPEEAVQLTLDESQPAADGRPAHEFTRAAAADEIERLSDNSTSSASHFEAVGRAEVSDTLAAEPAFAPDAGLERASPGVGAPAWTRRWREWTDRGAMLWVGFAAAIVACFAWMWLRLARRMKNKVELSQGALPEMLARLVPAAFPGGRRVRLFVVPELRTPLSFGFLHPSICVPPRALVELSPEEQETMLAHELAHLARRDPLWLSTAWLIERVFFFQPLNRIARSELHDLAELRCDDWAARRTGQRLALASCLARIAGWLVGPERSLPATTMADGHGRCRLSQRIERLLDEAPAKAEEHAARWVAPLAGGGLACLVLVVPGVSTHWERRSAERDEATPACEVVPAECEHARDAHDDCPPILEPADAPSAPAPDAALLQTAPPSLTADIALLDESVELLRAELDLLRSELVELAPAGSDLDRGLQRTLDALEMRTQNLERRRDQLRALTSLLETHPTTPAHPSSSAPTLGVP
jgi:hypothetical protein